MAGREHLQGEAVVGGSRSKTQTGKICYAKANRHTASDTRDSTAAFTVATVSHSVFLQSARRSRFCSCSLCCSDFYGSRHLRNSNAPAAIFNAFSQQSDFRHSYGEMVAALRCAAHLSLAQLAALMPRPQMDGRLLTATVHRACDRIKK